MLKLAYKVGSRGGAMVSTSARNAGDPWFESRSWYDRFLYVNIHLFIYIYIYISFTLSRHEPSSGLIASEISNSCKGLPVL